MYVVKIFPKLMRYGF